MANDGTKHDADKVPLQLLPFDALREVGLVLQHGAAVYGERNWERGLRSDRVMAAVLRHLFDWQCGEAVDKESGMLHVSHAATEALMLLALELRLGNPVFAPRAAVELRGNISRMHASMASAIVEEWSEGGLGDPGGPFNRCMECGATALPSEDFKHFKWCPVLRVGI